MRRRVPLIIGSTALVGLLLGLGAGSSAQTVSTGKLVVVGGLGLRADELIAALPPDGPVGEAAKTEDEDEGKGPECMWTSALRRSMDRR